MGSIVFAVLLLVAALVALVVLGRIPGTVGLVRSAVVAGLVLLAALVVAASCVTTVGTKDIGVVTVFGRPTGRDLPNGMVELDITRIHDTEPWAPRQDPAASAS